MSTKQEIHQARYLGADAALSFTSSIIMSEDDAKSIADDVDPEVYDRYPEPNLSGEMAGESIPEIFDGFSDPHDSAIHDAWEEGRDLVFETALQAVALRTLGRIDDALAAEQANENEIGQLRLIAWRS